MTTAEIFKAVPATLGEEPLGIGFIGPPGGGKTVSALRIAKGMQTVRKGPIIMIDSESGRSRKYSRDFAFEIIELSAPFQSGRFLEAIRQQVARNPAAIIVDSLSDEHEGPGGYLEWHDQIADAKRGEPGYVGGNSWAAWAPPKAARKRLISGLLRIKVPLLFTFRAREKTRQVEESGRSKIENIGWMPVAPLEIVHALDLTCILPPRANGVPVWSSEKVGEDFIVKLPSFLRSCITGGQLDERTGASLARWAGGQGGKDDLLAELKRSAAEIEPDKKKCAALLRDVLGLEDLRAVDTLPEFRIADALDSLRARGSAPVAEDNAPPEDGVLERHEIAEPFGESPLGTLLSPQKVGKLRAQAEQLFGEAGEQRLVEAVAHFTGSGDLGSIPANRETDILARLRDVKKGVR